MRPPALDPRTKLLLVLSVSSLSIFVGGPLSQLGLILLAWLLATYLGGEPQRMLRRLWRLFWVILPLVLLQSVFASTGTTLLRLGGL
jgi:energy-coupling factor transport system permease protein